MNLPSAFEDQMQQQLGDGYGAFAHELDTEAPVSVRLNPDKPIAVKEKEAVRWTSDAYYLAERPVFTLDPLFHAGAYYVQEASSMFIEQGLRQHLDLEEPLNVLDLCAAPGGKSTLIASLLSRDSLLVSNEVIRPRASILAENLVKWGSGNVMVTNNDPKDFQKLPDFFDVMVVDAPCSGEGMFRKDPNARQEWSPDNVQLCAQRQQRILMDVWESLKPGGLLIYSTCTFNELENEQNLVWLAQQHQIESLRLNVEDDWQIEETETNGLYAYRFYPHKVKGEGFFMTVLRKGGEYVAEPRKRSKKSKKSLLNFATRAEKEPLQDWLKNEEHWDIIRHADLLKAFPKARLAEVELLYKNMRVVLGGVELAEIKKKDLKPTHQLAMFRDLNAQAFATYEVSYEEALKFLQKEDFQLPDAPQQWLLLTFRHLPLGWVKPLKNRVNNHYPKEWRIRMDVNKALQEGSAFSLAGV
jgi:16S rRNA C967 or C1407 C5-methylase (RsmB/RsmF family)/NOL1/NOP2/fmu family ribosome biogenesis protein